jgi:hypothetical protein
MTRTVIVKLEVPVDIDGADDIDAASIGKILGYYLTNGLNWNDGRYPFNAEELTISLERCVMAALYDAIGAVCEKIHGYARTPHYNDKGELNGETATWYLAQQERIRSVRCDANQEKFTTEVSDVAAKSDS